MFILKLLGIFLLTFKVLKAENFSIMLSLAEQEALQQAQGFDQQVLDKVWEGEPSKDQQKKLNQNIIFLSAILYFSPNKWTVVLNDQIISAQSCLQGICLKSVTSDRITFNLNEQNSLEFSLRINQSFLVNEKKIMEGDQRFKTDILEIDKVVGKGKN